MNVCVITTFCFIKYEFTRTFSGEIEGEKIKKSLHIKCEKMDTTGIRISVVFVGDEILS